MPRFSAAGPRVVAGPLFSFATGIAALALIVQFTSAPVASAACLNTNPGFDLTVPNVGTANGWTGSSALGGWRSTGGNPGAYYYLNESGGPTDPSATQVVTGLNAGGSYILCGDFTTISHDFSPIGAVSFAVEINGLVVFTSIPTALSVWKSFAITFVAPASGTVTIKARAEINGTDNDFGIDNFCVKSECAFSNGAFDATVPATGSATGWTMSSPLGGWSANGGHPGGYFWLNSSGGGSADPTATQTISGLTPNGSYVLTGEYASIAHDFSPVGGVSFQIDVNGSVAFTSAPTPIQVWKPFTVPVRANGAGDATIVFSAETNGSDNDYGIDNLCLTPACLGAVVANGDFAAAPPPPAVGTGAGWTMSSNLGGWSATGGNPADYFWLNSSGDPNTDPSAQQTVSGLVAGGSYILTGDYASIAHDFSPIGGVSFAVRIDGTRVFTSAPTPIQTWKSFAIPFTATGTSVAIEFRAETDSTDNDYGIDNICIIPGPPTCMVRDADFELPVPSTGTAQGWTTASGLGGWSATGGNPNGYFWLNNGGGNSADPTAEQVVTGLTPGATYQVSGDYTSIAHDFSPLNGIDFAVDIDHVQRYGGATTPVQTWRPFTFGFTAPASGSVTLTFRAEANGSDNDYGIDNVCVSPGAVSLLGVEPRPRLLPTGLSASPNPFPRTTVLSFALPEAADVEVDVYDLVGRRVRHLRSGALPAGEHSVEWDGRDDAGTLLQSGLHFIRVRTGGHVLSTKVVRMH